MPLAFCAMCILLYASLRLLYIAPAKNDFSDSSNVSSPFFYQLAHYIDLWQMITRTLMSTNLCLFLQLSATISSSSLECDHFSHLQPSPAISSHLQSSPAISGNLQRSPHLLWSVFTPFHLTKLLRVKMFSLVWTAHVEFGYGHLALRFAVWIVIFVDCCPCPFCSSSNNIFLGVLLLLGFRPSTTFHFIRSSVLSSSLHVASYIFSSHLLNVPHQHIDKTGVRSLLFSTLDVILCACSAINPLLPSSSLLSSLLLSISSLSGSAS